MIKSKLLNLGIAHPVGTTIADMTDPRTFVAKNESRGGGSESAKFRIRLANRVDAPVGFLKGAPHRGQRAVHRGMLGKGQWNFLDRLRARHLADRVAAHAVGNDKHVAYFVKVVLVRRPLDRVSVLVMAATDADIRSGGVFEIVKSWHRPLRSAETSLRLLVSMLACEDPPA